MGGRWECDRVYISNLIKDTLNFSDDEYIKFVKENGNKAFEEIEPKEVREKIIKAFAEINSNTRRGNREYNEMYISNPKPPMGVFTYSLDDNVKVNNPLEFLQIDTETDFERLFDDAWGLPHRSIKEKTEPLRKYAIDNDIPFVVFGD